MKLQLLLNKANLKLEKLLTYSELIKLERFCKRSAANVF